MLFPIKVTLLVLAFMGAYVLRMYWVRPKLLEPSCLLNTDRCVKLVYYRKDNSALVFAEPAAFRIWFNGTTFYVYDVASGTGRKCVEADYEPAYEVQPKQSAVQKYACIRSLKSVLKLYEKSPREYAYIRVDDPASFSAFDVIRYLLTHRIVGLPEGS
jgi:hypothetical protein